MNSANIKKLRKEYCRFVQGAHPNLISVKLLKAIIDDKLGKVAINGTVVQEA